MKGIKRSIAKVPKKILNEILICKTLPYGKWITTDGKEYLFNRDYEPIRGYDLINNKEVAVTQNQWIENIMKEEHIYDDLYTPHTTTRIFQKCWNVLAEWSERERLY